MSAFLIWHTDGKVYGPALYEPFFQPIISDNLYLVELLIRNSKVVILKHLYIFECFFSCWSPFYQTSDIMCLIFKQEASCSLIHDCLRTFTRLQSENRHQLPQLLISDCYVYDLTWRDPVHNEANRFCIVSEFINPSSQFWQQMQCPFTPTECESQNAWLQLRV